MDYPLHSIISSYSVIKGGIRLGAFRIAAGMANTATTFIFDGAAAFRAGPKKHGVRINVAAVILDTIIAFHVLADGLGNSIRAGQHLAGAETHRLMTADAY